MDRGSGWERAIFWNGEAQLIGSCALPYPTDVPVLFSVPAVGEMHQVLAVIASVRAGDPRALRGAFTFAAMDVVLEVDGGGVIPLRRRAAPRSSKDYQKLWLGVC